MIGKTIRLVVSYVEHAPLSAVAHVLRTVWIQSTGDSAYVQRHLPTGGIAIHVPIGGEPRMLGPLTGPQIDVIPPRTTVVGARFRPGAAPPLSATLDDLVDQHLGLAEVQGSSVDRLTEAVAGARSPEHALALLQEHVLRSLRSQVQPDELVQEAVQLLMPWRPVDVTVVAADLGLSTSQLRRRCLRAVGVGPKALQRTLRFQGLLALAQAGATGRCGAGGTAGLAIDVGYADQAHLSRECRRLTGVSPGRLLGGELDRCTCGHDHAASYRPYLAARARPPLPI